MAEASNASSSFQEVNPSDTFEVGTTPKAVAAG